MTGSSTAVLVDLHARRLHADAAVARVAAAPVRHVPAAFLAALECTPVPPLRMTVLRLAR